MDTGILTAWPTVSGEMARRIRVHPWAQTPLGSVETWPERLKGAVDLVLASPIVSSVVVGAERLLIYNDAAARLYGARHPAALGRPLADVFADSYPAVAELYDRVFAGEAVQVNGQPLAVSGAGGQEIFDACLTPVRDADGEVLGVWMAGFEVGARQRTETALRESEARFRTMTDNVPVLIWETDQRGVISVNGHYLDFFGAPFEQLRGMGWARALHPDDGPGYLAAFREAFEQRRPYDYECRVRRADGQYRWLRNTGSRVGENHFVGASLDITDLLETQHNLRESEGRLRQFGEASQDVLWIRDAETFQWEYLTPAFETIYGLDRQAALQGDNMAGWLQLIVPEDRDGAAASLRRVHDGEWMTYEFCIRRPVDGQIRYLRNTDFPIKDASGKVVRIGGIGHDITPLKVAELALAEAEERQRALVEGIPQLVWRGVDDGEWTWASPQWSEFTGQAQADSHKFGWLDVVHPDDRTRVRDLWRGANGRGEFHADYRILHREGGRYRWFQTRAAPARDARGAIVAWLGASTDVQDLRSLQDRQRVLLFELQHRVRNMLAVVRSIASSTGETSETVEDFASHLEGRLSALARTQMVLTRAPGQGVDLENMVREELLAQTASETQILVEGAEVRLPPKAAEVLALALHELATNAVKYGALATAHGRIEVRWSTSEQDDRRWLKLTWEENGVRVAAAAPRREGFGTELIQTRVPYELRGRGALQFRPGGVRCEIEFPLTPGESMLQTNAPGSDGPEAER